MIYLTKSWKVVRVLWVLQMATVDFEHEDYSKRDRIFNALAVYPERYRMSNQVVAELADASTSYVYQLRTAIDEGEISDEEFESALDEELQSQYRERIDDLLEESGVSRSIDEDEAEEQQTEDEPVEEPQADNATVAETAAETQPAVRGADETGGEGRENGVVPIEEVERVRAVMEQYRKDAEFERERFEGSERNTAEEKYFIANRAVELLDQLIE